MNFMENSTKLVLTLKRVVLLLSLIIAVLGVPLRAQTTNPYRQDRILLKPLSNQITNLHASLGSTVIRSWPRFGNLQVVRIRQGASVTNLIAQYQSSGQVAYADRIT